MKRIAKIKLIIICICILFTTGCSSQKDPNIKSGYLSCEEYFDEDFMDYTDYCKYFYTEKEDILFTEDTNFTKVQEENIETVKEYFIEFPYLNMEKSEAYDFDIDNINIGDYYCILDEGKTNDTINYDVYLYDVDTHVLYYIHNNN